MTRALLFATLFLAACAPEAEAPRANEADPAPAVAEAPLPALTGTWDVTEYNGAPLQQVFDMDATFAGGRLTIASDCVRMAWDYTQQRGLVGFKPAGGTSCERGRTDNEDQVEEAIGRATIALFAKDGRQVELSGSGGTVTMIRR